MGCTLCPQGRIKHALRVSPGSDQRTGRSLPCVEASPSFCVPPHWWSQGPRWPRTGPRSGASAFEPADAALAAIAVGGQPDWYSKPGNNGLADLAATVGCSEARPRAIDTNLAWTLDAVGVDQVRVDITKFSRGFANGEFLTTGALAADAQEAFFADAQPGIYYYWRLLASVAGEWTLAANGRFEAPICPFDEAKE